MCTSDRAFVSFKHIPLWSKLINQRVVILSKVKDILHIMLKMFIPPLWVNCTLSRVNFFKTYIALKKDSSFLDVKFQNTRFCIKIQNSPKSSVSTVIAKKLWQIESLRKLVWLPRSFQHKLWIYKASALWADAFYKLICPSVCVSVCVFACLFTFKVPFKRLFAPTSRSQVSNIFSDLESFEHFSLEVV